MRHRLQEVASLRESKVGLESVRERQPIQSETDGEAERGRERERNRGEGGCSEDQSSHTTERQNEKQLLPHKEIRN